MWWFGSFQGLMISKLFTKIIIIPWKFNEFHHNCYWYFQSNSRDQHWFLKQELSLLVFFVRVNKSSDNLLSFGWRFAAQKHCYRCAEQCSINIIMSAALQLADRPIVSVGGHWERSTCCYQYGQQPHHSHQAQVLARSEVTPTYWYHFLERIVQSQRTRSSC